MSEPDPAASATLTVARPPADGIGDQYRITVKLDGELFAKLAPGQSTTRAIAPGPHRLRVWNTLMLKRTRFVAAAGEEMRFVTRNRRGPFTGFFMAMGTAWLYVGIERDVGGGSDAVPR